MDNENNKSNQNQERTRISIPRKRVVAAMQPSENPALKKSGLENADSDKIGANSTDPETMAPENASIEARDSKNKNSKADSSEIDNSKDSGAELSTEQHKALTEIDNSFHSSPTEQGFVDAKKDADKALAENKIILNNRFVLKETLGSGGMGTVYKAQDLRKVEAQDTNPYVAAKILNSDFRNHPDAFISLQREASRSHRLSHPNIVTVHDFDRDGDTIFMTMELLDGEDLESLLSRYKNIGLKKDEAFKIFRDFCVALNYAHKKGIIHSDLKPGNIFVTKEEGTKVLDFGIARLAQESKHKDHFDAGRIGAITPAYASLEMIGHQSPDARDDVFAAAIIAYELLTGRHPFEHKSAAAALAKNMKPARIDSLSKRQWKVLSQALELKRADRTSSIMELMLGLTTVPKFPIYRTVSIVLVVVLAWFVYNRFIVPNELSQVIEETMAKADQCFQSKNYHCAIESANAVLEIAPQHEGAIALGKQAKIQQSIVDIDACLANSESTDCAVEPLNQLEMLAPNTALFKQASIKVESKAKELSINQLIGRAQQCFDEQDFACVLTSAREVLNLSPNNQQASWLISKSEKAMQLAETTSINNEKGYADSMQKAQQCFKRGQFICAQKQAKLALEFKPDEAEAEDLLKQADFDQKQFQENLNKASRIVADGRICLQKRKYDCAIAKSESALEFVPNYKKALQLKRDATESIKQVKKGITID